MKAGLFSSVCTRLGEGGVVLQRLHEIGREGVFEERRHRACRLQLRRGHRLALAGLSYDHIAEPALQILEICRETEDCHDLARDDDVEPVLARIPVSDAAQRVDDIAQRPVIHVERALPADAARIDTELVAPVDVVVGERREQIVGRADRVEIASEVEVDVLHRHDLGIATAGRTALHAEAGPEARLAQADRRLLADEVQGVAESDGRRRLAFARRSRGDRADQDQLAVRAAFQGLDVVERQLCLGVAIGAQVLGVDAELVARDIEDRSHRRGLRDRNVALRVPVLVLPFAHEILPNA
jgi:hypothetical protein